jgi:hypothetical protein
MRWPGFVWALRPESYWVTFIVHDWQHLQNGMQLCIVFVAEQSDPAIAAAYGLHWSSTFQQTQNTGICLRRPSDSEAQTHMNPLSRKRSRTARSLSRARLSQASQVSLTHHRGSPQPPTPDAARSDSDLDEPLLASPLRRPTNASRHSQRKLSVRLALQPPAASACGCKPSPTPAPQVPRQPITPSQAHSASIHTPRTPHEAMSGQPKCSSCSKRRHIENSAAAPVCGRPPRHLSSTLPGTAQHMPLHRPEAEAGGAQTAPPVARCLRSVRTSAGYGASKANVTREPTMTPLKQPRLRSACGRADVSRAKVLLDNPPRLAGMDRHVHKSGASEQKCTVTKGGMARKRTGLKELSKARSRSAPAGGLHAIVLFTVSAAVYLRGILGQLDLLHVLQNGSMPAGRLISTRQCQSNQAGQQMRRSRSMTLGSMWGILPTSWRMKTSTTPSPMRKPWTTAVRFARRARPGRVPSLSATFACETSIASASATTLMTHVSVTHGSAQTARQANPEGRSW